MKKGISIFLIAVFILLQYGRFIQYRLCIWSISADGNTQICDCIKALAQNDSMHAAVPAAQGKLTLSTKAEDHYTGSECTAGILALALQKEFSSYQNHRLPHCKISSVWQPPEICIG